MIFSEIQLLVFRVCKDLVRCLKMKDLPFLQWCTWVGNERILRPRSRHIYFCWMCLMFRCILFEYVDLCWCSFWNCIVYQDLFKQKSMQKKTAGVTNQDFVFIFMLWHAKWCWTKCVVWCLFAFNWASTQRWSCIAAVLYVWTTLKFSPCNPLVNTCNSKVSSILCNPGILRVANI